MCVILCLCCVPVLSLVIGRGWSRCVCYFRVFPHDCGWLACARMRMHIPPWGLMGGRGGATGVDDHDEGERGHRGRGGGPDRPDPWSFSFTQSIIHGTRNR